MKTLEGTFNEVGDQGNGKGRPVEDTFNAN